MMKRHETMIKTTVSTLLLIVIMTMAGCKKNESPTVSVSDISVSPTALSMKIGETVVIKATIAPADATNKEVSWLSSEPSIATVDQTGAVRGLTSGKVTITAISKDGAKTASCTVKVRPEVTEAFTELSQKVSTAESALTALREELASLKTSTQSVKDKAEAVKALITRLTEQRNGLTALADEVKSKSDDLHPEEVTRLTEKLSALTNDGATLADEVQAYKTKLDKMLRDGKGSVSDVEIIQL